MPRRSFKHQHSSHYLAVCDKKNHASGYRHPPPNKKASTTLVWKACRSYYPFCFYLLQGACSVCLIVRPAVGGAASTEKSRSDFLLSISPYRPYRLDIVSQRLSSGAALVNAAPLLQAPAFLALSSGLRQKEPCQRLSTIAAPLVPQPASFAVAGTLPYRIKKAFPTNAGKAWGSLVHGPRCGGFRYPSYFTHSACIIVGFFALPHRAPRLRRGGKQRKNRASGFILSLSSYLIPLPFRLYQHPSPVPVISDQHLSPLVSGFQAARLW
jgi:hypothetical protein